MIIGEVFLLHAVLLTMAFYNFLFYVALTNVCHFNIPPISSYVIHSHKLFQRSPFFAPISPLSLIFSNPYFLMCPINPNCLSNISINSFFIPFSLLLAHIVHGILAIFFRRTLLLTEGNCHTSTLILID